MKKKQITSFLHVQIITFWMVTPVEQLNEVGFLIMCLHCLLAWNTQQFHKIITIPVELQLYQLNEFMYTFLQCSMLSVHHKV